MKSLLTLTVLTLSIVSFGQQLTFEEWQKKSMTDERLLPKFGENKKENKADKAFLKDIMKEFDSKEEASNHLVDLGFKYLYKGDLITAMYRFNQAYLLDEGNPNIYWGYGAVYMAFEKFELSREQYEAGLKIDKNNDNILIDYGTTYLAEFYIHLQTDEVKANEKLDKAIEKIAKAHSINPENSNSSYKLSICYLYKDNCEKAIQYLDISEKIGNANISEAYKAELSDKCTKSDIDCSSIKTGKYRIYSEAAGETIIERDEKYQIEENRKHGYKLKLEVTWIDDCTYQLRPVEDLLNPDNNNLPEMVLTCKVIELTENGYIQISSSDMDSTELIGELTRIE
ncbi:MAG: hypothetical protein JJU02_04720 [Cryomorphaceae bacterium]|nr:hypothetical protein [Cryomorphaceae bacterium]